ncbi:hypothetical protein Glove_41g141 [Diversispora epigaea]|uniref:Uncharacterized protein n=1 Tax=Diversispora epigaea TaxID=1348612 RepID=A0A397JM05_9GLOM|nr:hypothetical protein Glove_41g141 [Diversispora epigaea]
MAYSDYFKNICKKPNVIEYFNSKIRLGTFTYDKEKEHREYESQLNKLIKISPDDSRKNKLKEALKEWRQKKHKSNLSMWWKIPIDFRKQFAALLTDGDDDYEAISDGISENFSDESESEEDSSLIEFNSDEIKDKISNLIEVYPKMSPASLIICTTIKFEDLTAQDSLANGIINDIHLKKHHKKIYRRIINEGCVNELKYKLKPSVKLEKRDKKFIENHITSKYPVAPIGHLEDMKFYNSLSSFLTQMEKVWDMKNYIKKSSNINERSYSHQVVKPIFDLILYNIVGSSIEYDGRSKSTKNRNGGLSGPLRRPDIMVSMSNYNNWEIIFGEISNGPFAFDKKHYLEDELRLGKFSKDSWDNGFRFTSSFQIENMMDELDLIMIHFYSTKMDVYIMDCKKMKPFYRMCKILSLEIPIIKDFQLIKEFCNGILVVNSLVFKAFSQVSSINNLLQNQHESPIPEIENKLIPTIESPRDSIADQYSY